MVLTTAQIYDNIFKSLPTESQIILRVLKESPEEKIPKVKLQKMTNTLYQEKTQSEAELINSRFTLDVSTARLEGAGLVDVDVYGRVRFYKLSPMGLDFLNYHQSKRT